MANLRSAVFLLFPIFIGICSANYEDIPALIWTNIGAEFPNPLAGHTTHTDEFKRDYLENVAKKAGHTLVTFVQDKLSLEDIIDNADVYNEHSNGAKFANLKNLVETYTSVHLPSVAAPGDAIDRLISQFSGKIQHLKAPYNLKDLKLDQESSNIVICHLPSNDGKSFEEIDKIIGTVSSDLKDLGTSFTAIYTGRSASQDPQDQFEYVGRHLLAEDNEENPEFFFANITPCIFVYFEELSLDIKVKKDDKIYFEQVTVPIGNLKTQDIGKCANGSKTGTLDIVLTKATSGLDKFEVNMFFGYDKSGYWGTRMALTFTYSNSSSTVGTVTKNNVNMDASAVFGPRKFSYHCTKGNGMKEVFKNKTIEPVSTTLRFKQLQVQFNDLESGEFGYPNDCEGFFSITILSGLMAGIILASILAFGICMIVNISTMDRFDDPKGKTITVHVSDG